MPPPKSAARFALLFGLLYAVALAPWPGWRQAHARWFGGMGNLFFGRDDLRGLVQFAPAPANARPPLDLGVTLSPDSAEAGSSRRVATLLLDARGIGWVPTALTLALLLATPLRPLRRLGGALVGATLAHGYVAVVLGICVWQASLGKLAMTWLPYTPTLDKVLGTTLVAQMGLSFVVPILIWAGLSLSELRTGPTALLAPASSDPDEKLPPSKHRRAMANPSSVR